jgi:hypothetical protein
LALHIELTTQRDADCLNVSRRHGVGLLNKGGMPFRETDNQRRMQLRERVAIKAHTDIERREALGECAREARALRLRCGERSLSSALSKIQL